ncbi:BLUF domain-containing protein [Enterovibrio norvegicus]|uniref:BLUF domain-containing protein n=1 Tax=Enterovibrio norvegicus TaxID=188144 RepID=UPI003553090A
MSNNLQQIVYISSAERPFTESELNAMLGDIRSNNEALGITGMLLYKDGDFIQAIEGDEHIVSSLFEKICRDHRHYGIVEMMRKSLVERQFKDWSMGFHKLTNTDPRLDGFNRLFDDDPSTEINPGDAINLLLVFRE